MSYPKKLLALLTLCATVHAGAAWGETLRIGLSADVTSIDPQWNNSGPNVAVSTEIFDPLTLTDRNGRLIPGLATSWRAIDPLTWEIKLRHGVKFHDGSDFTAEDVIFSLERPNTLTGSPGPFTQFVRAIVGKQVIDRYTVRLKTATPYVLLPYDLNSIFIVSKKAATGATHADFDSGRAAIGTGPYKFVHFARSDRIELLRNDGYWGDKPTWDKVSLRLITNDAARLAALLSGDVDVIENVPTQDVSMLAPNAKFKLVRQVSWRTLFWHMDQWRDHTPDVTDRAGHTLAANPFKDPRVRVALSLAINREAIVSRIMEGLAIPASNLVSPGIFGYNDAIPVPSYDPERARQLLAQAGYPNGFSLTLHAPNNRYVNDSSVAQAVASMFAHVGIITRVVTEPWITYLPKARAGDFSFALVGWGSSLGDNTIKAQLATPNPKKGYGAWNFGRYSNPALDAMLDRDFELFNDRAREVSAKEIMATAMKVTPVIPMYHQVVTWAMRQGVSYPGRIDEFTLAQQFTRR